MIIIGLAGICCEKFTAPIDRITYCWNKMLVTSGSPEIKMIFAVFILPEYLLHVPDEIRFG